MTCLLLWRGSMPLRRRFTGIWQSFGRQYDLTLQSSSWVNGPAGYNGNNIQLDTSRDTSVREAMLPRQDNTAKTPFFPNVNYYYLVRKIFYFVTNIIEICSQLFKLSINQRFDWGILESLLQQQQVLLHYYGHNGPGHLRPWYCLNSPGVIGLGISIDDSVIVNVINRSVIVIEEHCLAGILDSLDYRVEDDRVNST